MLSLVVASPFIGHQFYAYKTYCLPDARPEWCNTRLPSIYGHVQSKYWNVGFLRYWEVAQIPNFLFAAPALLLIISGSLRRLSGPISGLTTSKATPYAIHALVLSAILLFASHVQIVLRLSSAVPVTYWSAARLLSEGDGKWGRIWVHYALIWGFASCILWATFLPPA